MSTIGVQDKRGTIMVVRHGSVVGMLFAVFFLAAGPASASGITEPGEQGEITLSAGTGPTLTFGALWLGFGLPVVSVLSINGSIGYGLISGALFSLTPRVFLYNKNGNRLSVGVGASLTAGSGGYTTATTTWLQADLGYEYVFQGGFLLSVNAGGSWGMSGRVCIIDCDQTQFAQESVALRGKFWPTLLVGVGYAY